jgi:hypothetical protein
LAALLWPLSHGGSNGARLGAINFNPACQLNWRMRFRKLPWGWLRAQVTAPKFDAAIALFASVVAIPLSIAVLRSDHWIMGCLFLLLVAGNLRFVWQTWRQSANCERKITLAREAEGGMITETPQRRRFRFNLKTLLGVMTLVAVGLGAYILGQKNGYRRGVNEASAEYQRAFHSMRIEFNDMINRLQKK